MAKFFGSIGYNLGTVETAPGVYEDVIVEHEYYGDVLRNTRRLDNGEAINNELSINNYFSLVVDAYAREHFHLMRYIVWAGTRWIVREVEEAHPRLLIRPGGVYNGPHAPDPEAPPTPGDPGDSSGE